MAQQIAMMPEQERTERLSNWDPHLVMLAQIADRLGTVIQAIVVGNGGAKPDIAPVKRPTTAVQTRRKEAELENHRKFVDRMTRRRED